MSIRIAGLSLLAFATTAPLATPASALELFGRCLFGTCDTQDGSDTGIELIDPLFYDLDFSVEDQADASVQGAVEGASQLYGNRDDAVSGDTGLLANAKGDYRRILAALYNQGHYGPSVSITIDGVEAADLAPGAVFSERPNVAVRVESGPQYDFGTVAVVDRPPEPDDRDDRVRELYELDFEPGRPAQASVIRRAGQLNVRQWRQLGYPKARVEDREAVALHPQEQLNVTLRMDPGRRADFGPVSVEGTERMDPAFVAYMTGLVPGEEYDPDTLARARKRLERLGVFSLQRFEEADEITAAGLLPINVVVKERKLRRIGIGATLSSIDGAGVEAFWLHRNLFGQAESLRLSAEVGGVGAGGEAGAVDELDYLTEATFTKPGIIDPDTDLVVNIFAKKTFNDTFRETSAGASANLNRYITERVTVALGGFVEYGEFEDAFGTRTFGTVGAVANAEYDLRDDELDPTEGAFFDVKLRPFYEWERGNAAIRTEAEVRGYYSIGADRGRSVLAARLKAGTIFGPGIEATPPDQLFLAGGGGSVRGYGFKNIGVPAPAGATNFVGTDNDIVGGKSLVEGSLEFRQRFGRSLGAVVFADAGAVSAEQFSDFGDIKIGVGAGVRYYTGLGPIRVDVAIPLNPDSGDPSFGIYAGIGHAF